MLINLNTNFSLFLNQSLSILSFLCFNPFLPSFQFKATSAFSAKATFFPIMKQLLLTSFLTIIIQASVLTGANVSRANEPCHGDTIESPLKCSFDLVESIPEGLIYNESITSVPTSDSLLSLIHSSTQTLDIASFYWTLKGSDVMKNASSEWTSPGESILNAIMEAARRGVTVRVAADSGKQSSPTDLNDLIRSGVTVKRLNVSRLVGAGILHTKFLISDNSSFYLGSANMDWRSFTQVKEMGLTVKECPLLAQDLDKIFQVYWMLSDDVFDTNSRPQGQSLTNESKVSRSEIVIPDYLDTRINQKSPIEMKLNQSPSKVYMSSSPKPFNPSHRSDDIDAILSIIQSADRYINIAVMDYYPMFLYQKPTKFWPVIDDALKRAVIERGVTVRLLASHWTSTRAQMIVFLKSLQAFSSWSSKKVTSVKVASNSTAEKVTLKETSKAIRGARGSIQVKLFTVPTSADEASIPFARVNHNKYMVTDKVGYIGTSNWSGDYFVSTAGVGFIAEQINSTCYSDNSLRQSLKHTFDRDWNSSYAHQV